MFHELLVIWFQWVEQWGYWGIIILMALESSIVPVPSEVVMPPAAYWAAQGRFDFWGVVAAGTVGSYFGSIANYIFFRWAGKATLDRWGGKFLPNAEKLKPAEAWVRDYGTFGIFIARLLPVVRHLISIPAGLLKMPFWPFSIATIVGAGIWCFILSWFGQKVLGDHPELLSDPAAMVAIMKDKLIWFVAAVVGFSILYAVMIWLRKKAVADLGQKNV